MKNPRDFNDAINALAVHNEVPWVPDNCVFGPHTVAAEEQMVGASTWNQQVWTFARPGPLRVRDQIGDRLLNQLGVTGRCLRAELLRCPDQDLAKVVNGRRREPATGISGGASW